MADAGPHTYDRDTTKGGHADVIPIGAEFRRCPRDQAKLWPKPQVWPLCNTSGQVADRLDWVAVGVDHERAVVARVVLLA